MMRNRIQKPPSCVCMSVLPILYSMRERVIRVRIYPWWTGIFQLWAAAFLQFIRPVSQPEIALWVSKVCRYICSSGLWCWKIIDVLYLTSCCLCGRRVGLDCLASLSVCLCVRKYSSQQHCSKFSTATLGINWSQCGKEVKYGWICSEKLFILVWVEVIAALSACETCECLVVDESCGHCRA